VQHLTYTPFLLPCYFAYFTLTVIYNTATLYNSFTLCYLHIIVKRLTNITYTVY